jgi:hypothetical protein
MRSGREGKGIIDWRRRGVWIGVLSSMGMATAMVLEQVALAGTYICK